MKHAIFRRGCGTAGAFVTVCIALGCISFSCGGGPNGLKVFSSSSASSKLTASATNLIFGNVAVDTSISQTFTLTNSGTAPIQVTNLTLTGERFSITGVTLPLNIPVGQTVTITLNFAPKADGMVSGTLSVESDAGTAPSTISLSGIGVAPVLSASLTTIDFRDIILGSSSTRVIVLTNTGIVNAIISQGTGAAGTGFSTPGLTLPQTITPGSTFNITVSFDPKVSETASGTLTVVSNATNSPITIPLSGTGGTALLTTDQPKINFGNVTLGSTPPPKTVTLTNNGTLSVTVSAVSAAPPAFSLAGLLPLPFTLTAGQSTGLNVVFSPTSGTVSGNLTVVSDATNSPLTISLSGTGGTSLLTALPTSINYDKVALGTIATQVITITNTDKFSVTISGAPITAAGNVFGTPGLTLPQTITPGSTFNITVSFDPQVSETASGTLTVVSNATNSSLTIPLSGTGATGGTASLTLPSVIDFGSVTLGSTPPPKTVTLTNNGTLSVTVSAVSAAPPAFSLAGLLPTPFTLTAGQSATFQVLFAPLITGSISGTLSVISNAKNSPTVAQLIGAVGPGGFITIIPSPTLDFGNVILGNSPILPVTVTNTGGATVTISQVMPTGSSTFILTPPPLPLILTPGQTTSFSLTFTPTGAAGVSGTLTITSDATNSPTNESLTGTGIHAVDLLWVPDLTQPSGVTVTGYNVYRQTAPGCSGTTVGKTILTGSPVAVPATTFTDTAVVSGQTYCYVVTALAGSVESATASPEAQSPIVP
jgi:hypothetical protein